MPTEVRFVILGLATATLLLCAASSPALTVDQSQSQSNTPRDVDVPFVVSAPSVVRTMLEMAKVQKQDFVIDLGSGDGRIVFHAAQKYGARGLGVEIDPKLVETAVEDTQKLKLGGLVNFRVQSLFETDLSPATVITMYLLPDVNLQLRDKLLQLKPGTRVVSHDWDMGDWQADEMRVIQNPEKSLGLEKTSKVFLWVVPTRLAGRWCGQIHKENEAITVNIDIEQRYQELSGSLSITTADAGTKKTVRKIPIRTNLVGNRFVISHGNQDIVTDADDAGLTLSADAPRPIHIADIGVNPLLGRRFPFFNTVPLAEPVRLTRGSDCMNAKTTPVK